jgi:hypothetical protein
VELEEVEEEEVVNSNFNNRQRRVEGCSMEGEDLDSRTCVRCSRSEVFCSLSFHPLGGHNVGKAKVYLFTCMRQ